MIIPALQPAIPLTRQRTRLVAGFLATFLIAVLALPAVAGDADRTNGLVTVHFAFSKLMFNDVNENDAKAAMKVYTRTIGEENGIDTGSGPIFLDGTSAIAEALRLGQIDLISLTAEEYLALESRGLEGPFLLSKVNQTFTEEYVLLVREDSGIRNLEDLRGRSLIISSDMRAALAPIWLEVLCRGHGLGPAAQVFTKITPASKPTQVVLPVFFGKTDACIVTRNGWEVMAELNPQVKNQLWVVAKSQPIIPGMSCFRRGLPEAIKQRIIIAAVGSYTKPSFKQLMALFKTEELSCQPVAVLDSTRQLLATYHQLCAGTNQAGPIAPEAGVNQGATEGKGH